MLKTVIKNVLNQLMKDLDSDSCNMTEAEMTEVLDAIRSVSDKSRLSKYAACQYLNISRPKFDMLVKENIIPKGKKIVGFKEKVWFKTDLDKIISNNRKM